MSDQRKIYRIMKLIMLLADKPRRTVMQLAKLLGTSKHSIYRDLQVLEELGYQYDKDENDAYFLFEPTSATTATFELEEVELLNQLIGSIDAAHPLRDSLRKKIYSVSSLVPLTDELVDKSQAGIVSRLHLAISSKKQVKLIKYQSASSDSIRDRVVEPITLIKANSQLCAYDVEKQQIRHFKVKRITDIQLLEQAATHDSANTPTDIFGFTSSKGMLVKLRLSKLAYRLLIEEFPDARTYISEDAAMVDRPYCFVYEARNEIGIGRFILGLPGEIDIEEPTELVTYLQKRIRQFSTVACFATEEI